MSDYCYNFFYTFIVVGSIMFPVLAVAKLFDKKSKGSIR